LETLTDFLWPQGLVFFTEDHLIPLHAKTLFDAAHVVTIIGFLYFGAKDCIKAFRE